MKIANTPRDEDLEPELGPFAREDQLNGDEYPNCYNVSAGLMGWRFLPVPETPPRLPEYVHIPVPRFGDVADEESWRLVNFTTRWNLAWEAGPLRTQLFEEADVPERLRWLDKHPGVDFRLIPQGAANPYVAYEPLFHLLTLETLRHCGLPPLRKGFWPNHGVPWSRRIQRYLPHDFQERLQVGFAWQLWPHLGYGKRSAYSTREPLVLLSNSLDFWLPYLDQVAQDRLREFGRVDHDQESLEALKLIPDDLRETIHRPRKGGDVWRGEEDAHGAMSEMVECADTTGRLRGIIDAARSNRIEDDFSPRWSYAREDFERRLYHKRLKAKVSFVELDDTIPVHCPSAEPDGNMLWQDLLTLCDPKERQVVVCLRSGTTRATEIAEELGYANHSPVSKSLAKIRKKVIKLLAL